MAKGLVLVDTSAWIEFLRPPSSSAVASQVRELLVDGQAVLCEMVLVELWNGAKGPKERKVLSEIQRVLRCFRVDTTVWVRSWQLAQTARLKGFNVPSADLVIVACALHYELGIVHRDKHIEDLLAMGRR